MRTFDHVGGGSGIQRSCADRADMWVVSGRSVAYCCDRQSKRPCLG